MVYQNGIVEGGKRDCLDRWKLIKPELPCQGIFFDVGSAEGFFCKSALEQTNMSVLSLEKDVECVNVQKSWGNKYKNRFIIAQCNLGENNIKELSALRVEVLLLLSVLHWFRCPDLMLKQFFSMSSKTIVEFPEPGEQTPHGIKVKEITKGNVKEYLKNITGRPVRYLGKTKDHLLNYRKLWLIENNFDDISYISSFICDKLNVVHGEFKND